VDVIRSGWTPDVCKVTNVHKTYDYQMDLSIYGIYIAPLQGNY